MASKRVKGKGSRYKQSKRQKPARPETEHWHQAKREFLNETLESFHRVHCRQPKQDIQEAKEEQKLIKDALIDGLKDLQWKVQRPEYTGSSYEGVKVSDGLEFDIMVIMKGKNIQPKEIQDPRTNRAQPGFVHLKPKSDSQYAKVLDENGHISATKSRRLFQSSVHKLLNRAEKLRDKALLRQHGPAIQIDVYKDEERRRAKDKTSIWFSVDLVLAYEIRKGEYYVSKPLKSDSSSWRRSFSPTEKEKFQTMDEDNGCRKQCLRILKVLRNRTGMKLTSYHLKTLLFLELDKPGLDWKSASLADRILGLLDRLQVVLQSRELKHYYIHGMNLLDTVSADSCVNMLHQVKKLLKSENSFQKTFDPKDLEPEFDY